MKNLLALFIFLSGLNAIKSDCDLNSKVSTDTSPIFIQNIGREKLFVPTLSRRFQLREYQQIEAYCASGFQCNYLGGNSYLFCDQQTISLRCENNEIQILYQKLSYDFNRLRCKEPTNLKVYTVDNKSECNKDYYAIAIEVPKAPSVFLTKICFDLDRLKINFLHYATLSDSPIIGHQPSIVEKSLTQLSPAEIPVDYFFIDDERVNYSIAALIGAQPGVVQYHYEEFYRADDFMSYIVKPLSNVHTINRFLGWDNLVRGNWKTFRKLLRSRSATVTYDVYLGTSGVVSAPIDNECNSFTELNLKDGSKTMAVPKYLWAYLKSRENETEEFVVIGVNSPYTEVSNTNESVLCEDICENIPWLQPMKNFRKLSTFGYIFCCRKEDVEHQLDGFPVLNISTEILISSTPSTPTLKIDGL